jgi:hypothetical protein
MYVAEEHRLKAISLTILGSISQLTVTMLMGAAGLIMLKSFPESGRFFSSLPLFLDNVVLYISLAVTVIYYYCILKYTLSCGCWHE